MLKDCDTNTITRNGQRYCIIRHSEEQSNQRDVPLLIELSWNTLLSSSPENSCALVFIDRIGVPGVGGVDMSKSMSIVLSGLTVWPCECSKLEPCIDDIDGRLAGLDRVLLDVDMKLFVDPVKLLAAPFRRLDGAEPIRWFRPSGLMPGDLSEYSRFLSWSRANAVSNSTLTKYTAKNVSKTVYKNVNLEISLN